MRDLSPATTKNLLRKKLLSSRMQNNQVLDNGSLEYHNVNHTKSKGTDILFCNIELSESDDSICGKMHQEAFSVKSSRDIVLRIANSCKSLSGMYKNQKSSIKNIPKKF